VPLCFIGAEFKFVVVGPDHVEWESIPNRCWSRAQAGSATEGDAVLTTGFNDAGLRLRLLPEPAGAGKSQRRGSKGSVASCESCEQAANGKAEEEMPARQESSRPSRYTFKPTVSCFEFPSLSVLIEVVKKEIWWGPADFKEFLEARMAIARSYQQHVRDGTMSSFPADLLARNESRRGLGLGRSKVRLNNTRAYLDAVVREQERQRLSGILDEESLASVACAVSATDRQYSLANAASDAEVAHAYRLEATAAGNDAEPSEGSMPRMPSLARIKKVESFGLFHTEEDSDESGDEEGGQSLAADAAGFGVSQEQLAQNGLRATGRRDASLQ